MAYKEYEPKPGELRMVAVIEKQQAEIERLRAENAKLKESLKEEYDRGWDEGIDAVTTENREC